MPVGEYPPDTVATSDTGLPATTPGDATPAIEGEAFATTEVEPAALHAVAAALLLASPAYDAVHRYVPAAVGVNEPDATEVEPAGNVTVEVNTAAAEHDVSVGPKARNTTWASLGDTRPVTVAVSVIEPPTTAAAVAAFEVVGDALPTSDDWPVAVHGTTRAP